MSVDDLEALFKRLDTSGDGKLDGAELLAWFHSPEFQTTPMVRNRAGSVQAVQR